MKQVIEQVYKDARSRTLHGTNDKLGFDWSVTRSYAEHFARLCLLGCLDFAAKIPTINDPSRLSS